jgi:hypothetical protein
MDIDMERSVPQRTTDTGQIEQGRKIADAHLLVRQVKELVELDAAVRERAERAALLELGGLGRVGRFKVGLRRPPS